MQDFKKTIRLGSMQGHSGYWHSIFCQIEFKGGELLITGVEGPQRNGNALGGCGQIVMHLQPREINPAPGWTRQKIGQFFETWGRWHLNKLRAGSPAQEQWLRDNPIAAVYPESHYDLAKSALADVGLEPDNGYSYGSSWVKEEIPEDILQDLRKLPETDIKPAWV